MDNPPVTPRVLFDLSRSDAELELLADEQANVFDQLIACNVLADKIAYFLSSLARSLPRKYPKRFTQADAFLARLNTAIVTLGQKTAAVDKIVDIIDAFCAGDISAVEELNRPPE